MILNPNLTPKLYQQLGLLNKFRLSHDGPFPPLPREADLALPLGDCTGLYMIRGQMILKIHRDSRIPRNIFVPYRASLEKCLAQLLLDIQNPISMCSATILAGRQPPFWKGGLIYIAPSSQPIGDAICQIEGPPTLVPIIRALGFPGNQFLRSRSQYIREISIFHSDPHPGLDQNWAHEAYFQLDLAIL
jgi:hypothetical protein